MMPVAVGRITWYTSSCSFKPVRVTSSHFIIYLPRSRRILLLNFLDGTLHVKRAFWLVVVLALEDLLKALDGFLECDICTSKSGKLLCYKHRLAKEALDTSRTSDCL